MSFYTILTAAGKAKLANAQALGTVVNLTQMAVGDSNGVYHEPTEALTALVHETWRGTINRIITDTSNPNWIIIEVVIPTNAGGFTVREAGVFDEDGDMIAVGKYPETYKPTLDEGAGKDLYVRMILEVTNASTVTLKIDPAVVLASRAYVDQEIVAVNQMITNHTSNTGIHVTRNTEGNLIENISGFASRSKIEETRLLGTWPHLATKRKNQYLTLDTGETNCMNMAFDGKYVYAVLNPNYGSDPGKIVKIDPVTLTKISTLTLSPTDRVAINIIYDGTYLYVWLATSPAKIVKINPVTMQQVGSTLTLNSGEDSGFGNIMAFDGTYIYGMCSANGNPVVKIDPNGNGEMIRIGAYSHSENNTLWQGMALAFDGNYLYSVLSGLANPNLIIKIDPTTMTKVGSTLTLGANDFGIEKMIFDGSFLYALGFQGTSNSSEVIKIDPGTMTKIGNTLRITSTQQLKPMSGVFDGRYLYIIHQNFTDSNGAALAKVDTFTMTQVGKVVFTADFWHGTWGMTMDGSYLYAASTQNPTKIWKRDLYSAFS
jgi:hypothetical protein